MNTITPVEIDCDDCPRTFTADSDLDSAFCPSCGSRVAIH